MTFDDDLHSVYQLFEDGSCEQVRHNVTAQEAVQAARHYTTSIGAQVGMVRQVFITDSSDHINFLWEYGRGIVYPTKQAMEKYRSERSNGE